MSTETTNKKIKIDNGTTFGRTYTDKAVDELLKNVDSIFDITPYLTSSTSISVDGYNALRNFVLTNKGGIIKFSMSENHYLLGPCTNIYEDSLIFSWSLLFDNGHYDADFNEYKFNNNGNITVSSLLLNQVLANPTENATEALSTVRIGNKVYSIPTGGGDIWLDITPYLNEDMTTISQEGYDLVYNAFSSGVENPNNKYVGILLAEIKMFYNELVTSDKTGLNFISNSFENGVKRSMSVTIYNDKSIEIINRVISSSNKIWYDLYLTNGAITITQEQYNEIKELIDSNSLAGITSKRISDGYFSLIKTLNGTFTFRYLNLTNESNNNAKRYTIFKHEIIIKPDLSVSSSSEEKYIPLLTPNLSNQSIISIKTDGLQQNLTIGDGLAIANGALKPNKYLKIDNYVTITSSTSGTISQDGLRLISEKLVENKVYEGVSFQGLEFAFAQYLLSDSCIFYGIADSAQMKLDVDMATGNYTATPVTDIQIGTFGPYLPPTPKNVTSKLYFVGLNNGELQWVQYTADDTLSNRVDNLEGRVDSLANEVSQYSGSISSLESRVSSLETASTSYAQASDVSTLDSRVSDIENTVASKSEVSVSSTGTATDTISYITVDGVEKKIDGGSGGGGTTLYKHELMFSDNNHDGDKVHLTIIKNVATPITKFAYSQLIANMVGCYGYKALKEYPFMSVIGIVSTGTTVPTDERTYIALMEPASGTVGQAMVLGDTAATDTVTEL